MLYLNVVKSHSIITYTVFNTYNYFAKPYDTTVREHNHNILFLGRTHLLTQTIYRVLFWIIIYIWHSWIMLFVFLIQYIFLQQKDVCVSTHMKI